jgi:hypothetical protein
MGVMWATRTVERKLASRTGDLEASGLDGSGTLRPVRLVVSLLALVVALWVLLPSSAAATWINSGSLNVQPTDSVEKCCASNITAAGGTPFVTWNEITPDAARSYLFTSSFSGGRWSGVGGLISQSADYPSITSVGGTPYLAWIQNTAVPSQVMVDRLVNGVWTSVGGPVAPVFQSPLAMTSDGGGNPWVAYNSASGGLAAADFSGGTWHSTGVLDGYFNATQGGPSMTSVDGVPWIAYTSGSNGTSFTGVGTIRVARIGVTVTFPGGPLNLNPARNAGDPSITNINGVPYVAWTEDVQQGGWRVIRVARFNGTRWVQVGAALNVDPTARAAHPTITGVNGVPWVAWDEPTSTKGSGFVNVKQFTDGLWQSAGSAVNTGTSSSGYPLPGYPSITTANGVPYISFVQNVGGVEQLHVIYPQRQTPFAVTNLDATHTKGGVTFKVGLRRRATVSLAITRLGTGREVSGKCVAQTAANKTRPSCMRNVTVGTLTFRGRSGTNKLFFNGRFSNQKRLQRGAYQMQATVSAQGQAAVRLWMSFTWR